MKSIVTFQGLIWEKNDLLFVTVHWHLQKDPFFPLQIQCFEYLIMMSMHTREAAHIIRWMLENSHKKPGTHWSI